MSKAKTKEQVPAEGPPQKKGPDSIDDLRFTGDHLWIRANGETITIGITEPLIESLEDVLDISLPEEDLEVDEGASIGMVSFGSGDHPLRAPVAGVIKGVNADLESDPETVAEDPYGEGWILTLDVHEVSDLVGLMDWREYSEYAEDELD